MFHRPRLPMPYARRPSPVDENAHAQGSVDPAPPPHHIKPVLQIKTRFEKWNIRNALVEPSKQYVTPTAFPRSYSLADTIII